jgi:argininosuccinate lyase
MAIGQLASMASVGKTPSAQVDNRIFAYGEIPSALDTAIKAVRLMSGVVRGLAFDTELMARRASDGYAQATDLAEVIMREVGLNYRDAHRVVGWVVRRASERGVPMTAVRAADLDEAAAAVLGRPLGLAPDLVAGAVDPRAIVASRAGMGGAAREPMLAMIDECRREAHAADRWRRTTTDTLAAAEARLLETAARLADPARAAAPH